MDQPAPNPATATPHEPGPDEYARLLDDAQRARSAAETGRQHFHDLFEHAPAMIAILRGPNHTYEFANPRYLAVFDKGKDILGQTVAESFPELNGPGILEILDDVYETGQPFAADELLVKLDTDNDGVAQDTYFNFVYQPYRDVAGAVAGIWVHAIDVHAQVTARKQIETIALALERQAHTFDIALTSIQDFVYTFDPAGWFTYSNKPLLDLLGLTLDGIVGKTFHDLPYPADLAATLQSQIQAVVDTGQPLTAETPYVSPFGKPGYYEYIFTPIFDIGGQVILVAGSTRDITERKNAEQALQESEERFRALADDAPLFIVIAG